MYTFSPFSEIISFLSPYPLPLLDLVVNDELGILVEHRVRPLRQRLKRSQHPLWVELSGCSLLEVVSLLNDSTNVN